jgi:hypothetical protein
MFDASSGKHYATNSTRTVRPIRASSMISISRAELVPFATHEVRDAEALGCIRLGELVLLDIEPNVDHQFPRIWSTIASAGSKPRSTKTFPPDLVIFFFMTDFRSANNASEPLEQRHPKPRGVLPCGCLAAMLMYEVGHGVLQHATSNPVLLQL